ncbi:MAG: thioesterase family protein [Vicinamibacterales bacterium]
MKTLEPGLRGTASCTVTPDQTAVAYGSGSVPVYATPAMVALMERASVAALSEALPAHQTSVGVRLEVSHLAATPPGETVRAEAVVTAVDGRKITFTIEAFDSTERIGEAVHERAIVSRDRFLERVQAKRR